MASATSTRDPQKWRGKYLRALNICPPNVEKPTITPTTKNKVRSLTYRSSENDSQSMNRRCSGSSEEDASCYPSPRAFTKRSTVTSATMAHSHGCAAFPFTNPPLQPPNLYPFTMKPLLARNRRCHTDPFDVEERMSAPKVPTTAALDRRRCGPVCLDPPPVPLFTWEEPVAMRAAGQAITNGWKIPSHLNVGVSRHLEQHVMDPEEQSHPDEEEEPDDIFEMEWEDTIGSKSIQKSKRIEPSINPETPCPETSRSCLSSSFIPPHQLIQRDCFSIGLRDQFKKLPTNPI